MRYLLLRLRSRLVGAYDRQSRKRQFANADRADQTARRHIGVVKPSHDRWIDIRRPHRFCYGRLLRYELGRALWLGNGRGFPRKKLHIWTALRPDAGEQQVRAAVLPILRHFIVAPSGDDRKATEDADFNVARPHDAIMQTGTLAIDVTRLAVDDGRRVNINEIVAVQPLESIEIALRLRRISRILGLQSLIRGDRAIAFRSLRPGDHCAERQAGKERISSRSDGHDSSHCDLWALAERRRINYRGASSASRPSTPRVPANIDQKRAQGHRGCC